MASRIRVYPARFEQNLKQLGKWSVEHNLEVCVVSKLIGIDPVLTPLILSSTFSSIGLSELSDLAQLELLPGYQDSNFTRICMKLVSPQELEKLVSVCEVSVQTTLSNLIDLERICIQKKKRHGVLLLVEFGDLREGVPVEKLKESLDFIRTCETLDLFAVGTNLSCFHGVEPDEINMRKFLNLIESVEGEGSVTRISSGSSSHYKLVSKGKLPSRLNHLRIGELLFLGKETLEYNRVEEFSDSVFELEVQVLECFQRPIAPYNGKLGNGAFLQDFADASEIRDKPWQLVMDLGRKHCDPSDLQIPKACSLMGSSSEYLVLRSALQSKPGDWLKFSLNYRGWMTLLQSKIERIYEN